MALSDLSFKLYTDAGLTTEFTGLYQLLHQTDLSDNPQDFQLWFGSNNDLNQVQATSDPGVDQITLTPTDTLAEWVAATAYTTGQLRQPTTPNGLKYKVTTPGTSHASVEPTWPTSGLGSTVTDGTVVWTLVQAHHPITELKLALTSGGLSGATGGAALDLGTVILGGVSEAVEVNLRITNTVTTVGGNTGYPEIGVFVNNITETEI